MTTPRLTIGIPTRGARPDRLVQAIGSALAQSTPAAVVVADQDGAAKATGCLDQYQGHPLVWVVATSAQSLWDNWIGAAELAGLVKPDYFAWLQDDDLLAPHFARRVVQCLDAYPSAAVYLARLGISLTSGLANWWQATGPMVPMDLLHGGPVLIRPELVVAGGYFTSWALSPGVAFRNTPESLAAVRRVPRDCDLFAERLVLAELCGLGPAVCDPAIVGYWVQHEGNESRRQSAAGGCDLQYPAMAARLDALLEGLPDWRDALGGWALMAGGENLRHWLRSTAPYADGSANLRAGRAIFARLLGQSPDDAEAPAAADARAYASDDDRVEAA
jgi:hypothetical protein